MWAKVESGAVVDVVGLRPDWRDDDGNPVSDAVLRAGGYKMKEVHDGNTFRREVEIDESGNPVLAEGQAGFYPVETLPLEGEDDLLNTVIVKEPNDWIVEADRVVRVRELQSHSLLTVKAEAARRIDAAAEGIRTIFLTPGSGQALEYQATGEEALRWASDPSPNIDNYPMLKAEWKAMLVGDPDVPAEQAAQDALANAQLWTVVGAAIKEVRRSAKVAVELAETGARVRQVLDWAQASYQQVAATGMFDPLPPA